MIQFFARGVARMAVLTMPAFAFTATAEAVQHAPEAIDGEFVVELRGEVDVRVSDFGKLSRRLGVQVVDRIRSNMVLVRESNHAAKNISEKLREKTLVARVEPNYIYKISKIANDPDFAKTWGLSNSGGLDEAGTLGIAGVDFGHPDLQSQAWTNVRELNGLPGVDDDGNGFIDDVHGYNFADGTPDSSDDNGHGTHCSGTIGAKGGDGQGLVGVNWDVSIMALKFLKASGSGSLANAIKAIDYARLNGAKIISNSWGSAVKSDLLKTAIEDANRAGILFVVAAGNESSDNDTAPYFPSSYGVDNILSVAAINNRGLLAPFSNYGLKTVHVAAPGVKIVSSVLKNGYEAYSGTSMATPHVAGIAALLLAQFPSMNAADLKKRILESARPLATLHGRIASGGLADAYYALSGLTPPTDPNDPADLPNRSPYAFSSAHPYLGATRLDRTIQVKDAKRIAVRFSHFETELGYDTVSFFDGAGRFVSAMSGKFDPGSMSPLIEGDTVTMKFASDETIHSYGFDVDAVYSD